MQAARQHVERCSARLGHRSGCGCTALTRLPSSQAALAGSKKGRSAFSDLTNRGQQPAAQQAAVKVRSLQASRVHCSTAAILLSCSVCNLRASFLSFTA